MESAGITGPRAADVLRSVVRAQDRGARLLAIQNQIGVSPDPALTEVAGIQRVLLIQTALTNLDRLESTPVTPAVRLLFCDEFQFFARPSDRQITLFQPDGPSFRALAKIALLERFPAGEFQWEISGFPRSWLLRVPPSELPRVVHFLAFRLKGFAPCVVPHMAIRRRNPLILLERESDRSWHRIARSVEMQPGMKGLVACSWLHSADTFKVSPHLAFMNKPFLESGALVTSRGKADERSGFLTGSAARRKLYESGEFQPTLGLILWSREQMIRWAHSHMELSDE